MALRALRPSLPLAPDLLNYTLRLPTSPARVFFSGVVSLLPGTMSAEFEGRELKVHVLWSEEEVLHNLRKLEERVAELFGLELTPEEALPEAQDAHR